MARSVAPPGRVGNGAGTIDEQAFSFGAVRPDLLEVASTIHDIFAQGGPFARARGDDMANWQDPQTTGVTAATVGVPRAARDAGLRSYMLSVYNYMASGVLLTGIVAMLFAPYAAQVLLSANGRGMGPVGWLVTLSPLAIVFAMSFGMTRMRTGTLQLLFWAFAGLMGLSMSTLFLVYTGASIAQTFFATAAAYAALSLYGYTTKRDLSGIGTFLIMGVVGILVAMLVNMFLHSSAMALMISAIGVLLFAGLTAYDTQRIKSMYFYVQGTEMAGKTVIMGALTLYLDFINMFQFLLSFMGDRR
jgi:FtsH-binding integral membrane protein